MTLKTILISSLASALAVIAALASAPTLAQDRVESKAAASPRDDAMTPEQIREDFAIARKALAEIHPGYTRYTSAETLEALWADSEAKALANPTRGGVYLQISRVLAAIRCDHTKAELPKEFEEARLNDPV